MAVWMTEDEAAEFIGRTTRTLRYWRSRGWVRSGRRGGRVVYDRDSLRVAKLVGRKRMIATLKQGGPGRTGRFPGCDPTVDPTLF